MQLEEFRQQIIEYLSSLSYVKDIQISEVIENRFTGQAKIKVKYILNIRFTIYKEILTLSIALIYKNKRIWGIDKDNRIGWHVHPLENPAEHRSIPDQSIQEILEMIDLVCSQLEG